MSVLGKGIFEKITLRRLVLDVPEWNGTVLLQELTPQQVEEVQAVARSAVDIKRREAKSDTAMMAFQLLLVAKGWINEDGSRVLQDSEADKLRNQSYAAVSRMGVAISELSGLTEPAAQKAAKN